MGMKKRINLIISSVSVLIIAVVLGVCFDYYYDLNDDVLIKDILSGAYSGIPSAYNNQNLWLFGAFVSILYRVASGIPWYGLILVAFQYISVVIIEDRTLKILGERELWIKIMTAVSESLLLVSLMLSHLVNIQYTLTVAFMAGAAIMWILASDNGVGPKAFVKENVPAIVILFLAFNIRSEMLLLMLPFVCVSGLVKWSCEKKFFTKENCLKYICTLTIILGTLLFSLGTDKLAYSGEGWRAFRSFFDARTQLYDFQVIPSYEGNEQFYEGIGLLKEEQLLLENYNFGLDKNITDDIIWNVANYADGQNPKNTETVSKLRDSIRLYIYQLTHGEGPGTDYPLNLVGFAMYLVAGVLILNNKKTVGFLNLLVLFGGRTLIWLYMMMGDRMPDRITHSLYFVEICLLVGIIAINLPTDKTNPFILWAIISVMLVFIIFPKNLDLLKADQKERESVEDKYESLYGYISSHEEEYFLMDVYSSVDYTEKIFGPMKTASKRNVDLMGGWICFSPLQEEKEKAFGIIDMEGALLSGKAGFINGSEQQSEWLCDYYSSKGCPVSITMKTETGNGRFGIYKIEEAYGNNG